MIDTKELRIGNMVQLIRSNIAKFDEPTKLVKDVVTIASVHYLFCGIKNLDRYSEFEISFLHPIKITPEWLEHLGFRTRTNERMGVIEYFIEGFSIWTYLGDCAEYMYDGDETIEIKSIHQLQNLYYANRGTELKYNQK